MWYVIWTLTGHEKELIDIINEKVPKDMYIRAWSPVKEELRKYQGEETSVQLMLFPGYVFIDTTQPKEVHELLYRNKNYIGFLKCDDEFISVSEGEKQIISHFMGESDCASASLGVMENGTVLIIDGPLKGMEDKIVKIDRHKKKAWVLIPNLLGQDRKLSFALEVVEKH
ncbi:MAG: antiterminator LoaP [Eubacterium sp.]|nr:antiterminator LoaP [Eubacterium sp.]